MKISLIIPVLNESDSLAALIASIKRQTLSPDEIIFVDSGSTDNTIDLIHRLTANDKRFRVIEIKRGTPGRGRNVGVINSQFDWIAFTDGGITLEDIWLEKLAEVEQKNPAVEVIYGNVAPIKNTMFAKCSILAYIPPEDKNGIRRSIASSLIKKEVWQKIGGFTDFRASEDLIFMEAIEAHGFQIGYAPQAMIHWHLAKNFQGTFRKFILYSKHNVFAGRQKTWHYGILRQNLIFVFFLLLGLIFSWWLLLLAFGWLALRTAKRIYINRRENGLIALVQPQFFFGVMLLILTIDIATFIGWWQAEWQKKFGTFSKQTLKEGK